MQLMQRFGAELDTNDQYVTSYLEEIVKHPGSCDNIWLGTLYGFPPMEVHRKMAERYHRYAKQIRDAGISVSLQLSNSLGHGEYMASKDCSGLVFDASPVEKVMDMNGTVANYCFCWRGKHLREYLLEEIALYVEAVQPDVVWVDDDFRASGHNPVSFGCFCPDCVAEFNRQHKTSFSRDALAEEILHGNPDTRRAYLSFVREGLSDLMREIGKNVHRVSPKTALGYQHGDYGVYMGADYNYVFDAMYETTGIPPLSRPGGGSYNDHNPAAFFDKGNALSLLNSRLPDYVTCRCPEIENLPFSAYGKSPVGTAFETSNYFARGNTDMSYSMIMDLYEPWEWHAQEFDLFARHRPYWEALSAVNLASRQAGMRIFVSARQNERKLAAGEGADVLNRDDFRGALAWERDAIPLAFDRGEDSVLILHPEQAAVLSTDEWDYLLTQNVITDGETAEILNRRGFRTGLTVERIPNLDVLRIAERMTAHPVNPAGMPVWKSSHFSRGKKETYALFPEKGTRAEILGTYFTENGKPISADGAAAELLMPTGKGGTWAVLGYMPWKGVINLVKRDHLLNIADYIGKTRLPARLVNPVQAVLLPRKDRDGKTVAVSLINCTIGESGETELLIRDPKAEKFTFRAQYRAGVLTDGTGKGRELPAPELPFEKRGADYLVRVPSLAPYSVGTVFIG